MTTALRGEKKSKAWESTSLKQIAGDVAGKHGLTLHWQGEDVKIKRCDQRQENDLKFLQRICRDYGIKIKVAEKKLICISGQEMDNLPAVVTLTRGQSEIIDYSFTFKGHGTFKEARVSYLDPKDRKNKKHKHKAKKKTKVGQTLKVNEKVESPAQAEKRAKGELWEKNKDQTEGSFNLSGTPNMFAGTNLTIAGFGSKMDGLWHIKEARHSVSRSDGYKTSISIRKTIGF